MVFLQDTTTQSCSTKHGDSPSPQADTDLPSLPFQRVAYLWPVENEKKHFKFIFVAMYPADHPFVYFSIYSMSF